ncbi:SET domain-containing protein [Clavulina sp. PMI_390]|nr:SET domain-containing protein [Clavulina sp. PMI_390]
MTISQSTYEPTHPEFGRVQFVGGDFRSSFVSTSNFRKGDKICAIWGPHTHDAAGKAYSTLQYAVDKHCELESDLLYLNHSCSPNIAMVMNTQDKAEWHIRAIKDINAGDEITFFYPSTEWEMGQPFDCTCGAEECLKRIEGAKALDRNTIECRGYIAPHIIKLIARREIQSPSETQV